MKKIQLTQGKIALVDDDMFEYLNQWRWYYNHGYAVRKERGCFNQKQIFMHCEIMKSSMGREVDHSDNDGLNNQRYNLRICTHAQNLMNQKKSKDNHSGYKGIYFYKGKWVARIGVRGKSIYLGRFDTIEEAVKTYDNAARVQRYIFLHTVFWRIRQKKY